MHHDKERNRLWRQSHRERLVALAHDKKGREVTYLDGASHPKVHAVDGADAAGRYLDIKFGGDPLQCGDGACEEMANEYVFGPVSDKFRSDDFKYLIDVSAVPSLRVLLNVERSMETDGARACAALSERTSPSSSAFWARIVSRLIP